MANEVPDRDELIQRLAELYRETNRIEALLDPESSPVPAEARPQLLSLTSHHSSDLLSVHTIEGNYLWASPSTRRFLRIAPEELRGRSAYDFYHHVDVEQVAETHARHLQRSGEELSVRYRLTPARGNERWVETHTRVTPDGNLLVSITRNIDDGLDETDPAHPRTPGEVETLPLPRIATRESLEEALDRELDRARRHGHELSVALFDIDGFTRIGDEVGHSEALRVLRNISFLLRKNQRIYDTLGRWGRDEFLLLLPETALDHAGIAAERYRKSVEAARLVSHGRPVTISAGLASANRIARVPDLLAHVGEALDQAKSAGRNRVATFPGH